MCRGLPIVDGVSTLQGMCVYVGGGGGGGGGDYVHQVFHFKKKLWYHPYINFTGG